MALLVYLAPESIGYQQLHAYERGESMWLVENKNSDSFKLKIDFLGNFQTWSYDEADKENDNYCEFIPFMFACIVLTLNTIVGVSTLPKLSNVEPVTPVEPVVDPVDVVDLILDNKDKVE